MNKVLYKPLGLIFGALGGVAATAAFKQVWKRISDKDDVPEATDRSYSWREVLIAAAIQGAIFGAVKAAVDRAGAEGYRKATGEWPGE
jgi:hypothetical protein